MKKNSEINVPIPQFLLNRSDINTEKRKKRHQLVENAEERKRWIIGKRDSRSIVIIGIGFGAYIMDFVISNTDISLQYKHTCWLIAEKEVEKKHKFRNFESFRKIFYYSQEDEGGYGVYHYDLWSELAIAGNIVVFCGLGGPISSEIILPNIILDSRCMGAKLYCVGVIPFRFEQLSRSRTSEKAIQLIRQGAANITLITINNDDYLEICPRSMMMPEVTDCICDDVARILMELLSA